MHVNAEGWLVAADPGDPQVQQVPAHPARVGPAIVCVDAIPVAPVWHTTDVLSPAERSARNWQDAPRPGETSSAHVIIGRDGVIQQCVPFRRIAYHVRGGGHVAGAEVRHVNYSTVGIELENVGAVRRLDAAAGVPGFYGWPYYRRDASGAAREELGADPLVRLDDSRGARVDLVSGRYCDAFPDEQVATAGLLLRALVQAYSWRREWSGMGHVDYEPARKLDPWPLWRERLQPLVLDLAFAPSV